MTLTKNMIKNLLDNAGVKYNELEADITTGLYNLLDDQLHNIPAESLGNIEPNYIQPTRPERQGTPKV